MQHQYHDYIPVLETYSAHFGESLDCIMPHKYFTHATSSSFAKDELGSFFSIRSFTRYCVASLLQEHIGAVDHSNFSLEQRLRRWEHAFITPVTHLAAVKCWISCVRDHYVSTWLRVGEAFCIDSTERVSDFDLRERPSASDDIVSCSYFPGLDIETTEGREHVVRAKVLGQERE